MHALRRSMITAAAAALLAAPAAARPPIHPLRFFEGITEGIGTIKLWLRKPYRTRSLGRGRIEPDGTLTLVQRVEDDGKPARERRWRIRQAGPHRFTGTMSEAVGPVSVDEVGGRYRFRFKMKGNLSVEQWMDPLPGGMAARNTTIVRKLGMTVGTSDGTIRKLSGS